MTQFACNVQGSKCRFWRNFSRQAEGGSSTGQKMDELGWASVFMWVSRPPWHFSCSTFSSFNCIVCQHQEALKTINAQNKSISNHLKLKPLKTWLACKRFNVRANGSTSVLIYRSRALQKKQVHTLKKKHLVKYHCPYWWVSPLKIYFRVNSGTTGGKL